LELLQKKDDVIARLEARNAEVTDDAWRLREALDDATSRMASAEQRVGELLDGRAAMQSRLDALLAEQVCHTPRTA
jgi:hypothetical protein